MSEKYESKTLLFLIIGIWVFCICVTPPVLLICKDRLRGELGLVAGALIATAMVINMNATVQRAIHMEAHQSAFCAWSAAGRLLVVAALFVLFGITGWLNIVTMLVGIFGLKISAYSQPLIIKFFQKNKL